MIFINIHRLKRQVRVVIALNKRGHLSLFPAPWMDLFVPGGIVACVERLHQYGLIILAGISHCDYSVAFFNKIVTCRSPGQSLSTVGVQREYGLSKSTVEIFNGIDVVNAKTGSFLNFGEGISQSGLP